MIAKAIKYISRTGKVRFRLHILYQMSKVTRLHEAGLQAMGMALPAHHT